MCQELSSAAISSREARSRPAKCFIGSMPRHFRLNCDPLEAALAKATAVFDQEDAERQARRRRLAPTRAISQSQLELAIASLRQAEAEVAARKADVARAKLNLDRL